MIKYLGSKRLLLPDILSAIQGEGVGSVFDVFSGTSRVGHFLKKHGYQVITNDYMTYAKILAECYVKADRATYIADAERLVAEYNAGNGRLAGYFTDTFCIQSRFFQPKNGERVDFIREDIEQRGFDPLLKSILLTSLMEAADRVDSTCGLQMAYLKNWAPRASKDLVMRVPDLVNAVDGVCEVYQGDSNEIAKVVSTDVAYVDPPYNTHSYLGNYHIWESLCVWDKPDVYGVACKRVDVKDRKSKYNFKKQAVSAFTGLIENINAKKIVVSFSDEGFIGREEMEAILATRGSVETITKDFKRYVGAQIGIHNLDGQKVGRVSHLRNKEYIYVLEVSDDPIPIDRAI